MMKKQQQPVESKELEVIKGRMRQSFSQDERKEIVERSLCTSLSQNQFAKSVGISAPTLVNWKKKYQNKDEEVLNQYLSTHPSPSEFIFLQAENEQLKKELYQLHAFIGKKLYEGEKDAWKDQGHKERSK